MNNWFTSDQHWGHQNIIKCAKRPFKNVDDMNQAMIDRWNEVVQEKDTVYLLGDVSFFNSSYRTVALLNGLKGRKHYIFGNHDKALRKSATFLDLFESVSELKEIKIPDGDASEGNQRITLCHYAMRTWNKAHYGAWHLYGHSHGNLPDDPNSLSLDVGVDSWDFAPVSFKQIKERMAKKNFKSIDHHGGGL